MSENNGFPGVEPTVAPVPQANPYAPPQPYPGAAVQPSAPNYYPPQQQPYAAAQPYAGAQPYAAAQPYAGAQPYSGGQPYAAGQPYATARPTSGLAVASLVTGIGGIVLSFAFVTLLASIVAVITGHMALKQLRQNPALGGRGLAITGLILGYIGAVILAITVLIGVFSLFLIGSVGFLPFFLS
ncbi:DUF4190 domain-containing protein [Microbacterium sp. A93]|uniref:DUF4190 domain-containing protein n=1 Tax=Microbacterium sp. A93 TaxID=3450716 RepID=UPI003F43D0D9